MATHRHEQLRLTPSQMDLPDPLSADRPQLHTKQLGGCQGSSTAHATQVFLNDLDTLSDTEAMLAFDVYHAFDSPPKYLTRLTLQRMGTPTTVLLLISHFSGACHHGA